MKNELTAEDVLDIMGESAITTVNPICTTHAPPGEKTGWHRNDIWLSPDEALDLFVGRAKRALGCNYRGVSICRNEYWQCEVYRGDEYGSMIIGIGKTEAEAIFAAHKKWMEC